MPGRAAALQAALADEFPGRDIHMYPGDCNNTIDAALADLAALAWAPTFAFLDQQGAEVHWNTLVKLAHHKRRSPYKVELWMLFAHAQLPRGLGIHGATDEGFADNVTRMLGTEQWRAAYDARRADQLTGGQLRDELTNWMRWRLEHDLAYKHTHAFELRNEGGTPVYSMVFATDNAAGNRIMSHLYAQAAEKHPKMREEALALAKAEREELDGELALFPPLPRVSTIAPEELYRPSPPTVPYGLVKPAAE
jgi:three-Cys-motif partner protein